MSGCHRHWLALAKGLQQNGGLVERELSGVASPAPASCVTLHMSQCFFSYKQHSLLITDSVYWPGNFYAILLQILGGLAPWNQCVLAGSGRSDVHFVGCSHASKLDRSIGRNDPLFLSPVHSYNTVIPLQAVCRLFLDDCLCHPVTRCSVTLSECTMTHSRDLNRVYLQRDLWFTG